MYNSNENGDIIDFNNYRYVGWDQTIRDGNGTGKILYNELFTQKNIDTISKKVTELLEGLDPSGKQMCVSDEMISSVISDISHNQLSHMVGSGLGRYLQPANVGSDIANVNLRVVNVIVTSIKNYYTTIENNKKLSIWTSVYGDFNEHGLRGHAPIKIRNKLPQQMMFNMNY